MIKAEDAWHLLEATLAFDLRDAQLVPATLWLAAALLANGLIETKDAWHLDAILLANTLLKAAEDAWHLLEATLAFDLRDAQLVPATLWLAAALLANGLIETKDAWHLDGRDGLVWGRGWVALFRLEGRVAIPLWSSSKHNMDVWRTEHPDLVFC